MHLVRVPIAELHEDPDNVRQHNPRNIAAIRASLQRFGQRGRAVVAKPDGTVIAGNGMLAAARELGWTHVDVHYANDLEGDEARAFAIADNRSGELSFFDESALTAQLASMAPDLVELIGFDAGDLADMAVMQDQQANEASGRPRNGVDTRGEGMSVYKSGAMVKVSIAVATAELFENAMLLTGQMARADALQAIAQHYIDTKGLRNS